MKQGMKEGFLNSKRLLTLGLVMILVGGAVSAQATGFVDTIREMDSTFTLIPLMASIAFACNRKKL
jgi:hypothetical protein